MKATLTIDEQVVTAIFTKYSQAKAILATVTSESNTIKEASVGYGYVTPDAVTLRNYHKHVQVVDTVLALLPKKEYSYIIRTFVIKSPKNWWKKHYAHHDYVKLQKMAINRFLYLYLI